MKVPGLLNVLTVLDSQPYHIIHHTAIASNVTTTIWKSVGISPDPEIKHSSLLILTSEKLGDLDLQQNNRILTWLFCSTLEIHHPFDLFTHPQVPARFKSKIHNLKVVIKTSSNQFQGKQMSNLFLLIPPAEPCQ